MSLPSDRDRVAVRAPSAACAVWLCTVIAHPELPCDEKRWMLRHTPRMLDDRTARRLVRMLAGTEPIIARSERVLRALEQLGRHCAGRRR